MSVTLLAGSRSGLGGHADARMFYGDVQAVNFDPALATDAPLEFEGGPGTAPIHPSFEDRPGAPDRVFAALDDLDYERQVRAWCRELERAGAPDADVLHLHHLTPLNEAAARVAPHVPVVGQLHGTELLMLERIDKGAPPAWRHAERWAQRMRGWAERCERLIVAPAGAERAAPLLDVAPERFVTLPGGVDTSLFVPDGIDREQFWHQVLVEQPQGWLPDQDPGSAHYSIEEAARLAEAAVLIYVGRFTAVKRLDRLIAAFAAACERSSRPAGLVLVGGHPGEWENEHPADIAAGLGVADVFLAGWYGHDQLPPFFRASDAVVTATEREQFGQVLVEGMACGLPAVAPRLLGPASIIEDGETGWLVEPGDEDALAGALAQVIEDEPERLRRGRAAREVVCERFSWTGVARRLATVLREAVESRERASALEA
jgi:glycosyltransferase involved in cell wall biosynthesis